MVHCAEVTRSKNSRENALFFGKETILRMLCNKLVISSLVLVLFLSFGGSNAAGEDELASTISSTNTTYDLESTTYEYQYDAVPTPDRRDLKRVFNAESKLIRNDIIWYDNKGKSLKANRCGSISKTKINGLWYMVGSESSPVWVREKYCSC